MSNTRTCWVYCPRCRRDLNGDNDSWVAYVNRMERYRCASCGFRSEFDFDPPAPVFLGEWDT